jgi:hypothetical protein
MAIDQDVPREVPEGIREGEDLCNPYGLRIFRIDLDLEGSLIKQLSKGSATKLFRRVA